MKLNHYHKWLQIFKRKLKKKIITASSDIATNTIQQTFFNKKTFSLFEDVKVKFPKSCIQRNNIIQEHILKNFLSNILLFCANI